MQMNYIYINFQLMKNKFNMNKLLHLKIIIIVQLEVFKFHMMID